jgi:starvation-inducible DNA-binding protein
MDDIVIQGLKMLQADHEVFYGKLRNYHWTVKGPRFFELHQLFEQLYTETALTVDELAERLVALGEKPVTTYSQAIDLARLKEDATSPSGEQMLRNVHTDLDHLISSLKAAAKEAEGHGDTTTFNLLDGKADQQEKHAWMIRSSLG